MRYQGQSFEIEVPLAMEWLAEGDFDRIAASFHAEHERLYGHADTAMPIQIISLRMVVIGASPQPQFPTLPARADAPTPVKMIDVYLDSQHCTVPLYRRGDLGPGHRFASPCVIAQDDTTICVPAGFAGSVDAHGNILLTRVD
jgi:N-methylhydantoinase A